MSRRILFLVNGLGLGNSTRCHAIMQELIERGAEIEVVTSDNGEWYFADKPEIGRLTKISSLRYGKKDGHISVSATLSMAGEMRATLAAADSIISGVIERFRPDAVVTDSTYSFRPVRRAGLKLVALNNSDMVVRGMRRFTDWPVSVLPQFTCIECLDYLYHRFVPDLVLSPRLDPADQDQGGTFRRVGLIVRRECRPVPLSEGPPRRVVIMLSGSAFGSQVHLARSHSNLQIDVIGRSEPAEGKMAANVTFHGKLRNSLPLLAQADLVVVNGGFSAVSEVMRLQKPLVVIPVPRHSEQWVNGRTIAHLGIGMSAAEDRLEAALEEAVGRIDRFRDGYRALGSEIVSGSPRSAELILAVAGGGRA